MHPDFNLNTIAYHDLPLPLSTLLAFFGLCGPALG